VARKREIAERLQELKDGFSRYLEIFRLERPFGDPISHRRTLALLREAGSPSRALEDDAFVSSLWNTLVDWGMNTRRAELAPLGRFTQVLRSAAPTLEALAQLRIDTIGPDDIGGMWSGVASVSDVTSNKAKLVSTTKTLHHILPDLFVPIDREYTATFFRWWGPELQNDQERVFRRTYEAFIDLARSQDLPSYLDNDWNSSLGKVIDNAVVGYVRAMRGGAPGDVQLDVVETQERLAAFADERDWAQFHTPKNLAMALAAEAGELLEIFQWLTDEQSAEIANSEADHTRAAEEIADVMIYALRLADVLGIPVAKAVSDKLDENAERYPADLVRGDATKYSRRPQ
jgi:dCTP diphosphatase